MLPRPERFAFVKCSLVGYAARTIFQLRNKLNKVRTAYPTGLFMPDIPKLELGNPQ